MDNATPMKICVDAREFIGRGNTGIGRYLENLLQPLADRPNLQLVLFSHDPDLAGKKVHGHSVRHVRLPAFPTQVVDQWILPVLAQRECADVFFSPYYKIPLWGKFKKVITVHDIMFLRLPGGSGLKKKLAGIQLRWASQKADLILADSKFTRKDLSEWLPATASKTRVVYPGLEAEWAKPVGEEQAAAVRQRYAGNAPFLLYVGNFKPHKNVDLLIEAFLKLAEQDKTASRKLLLVGGDPVNLPRIESLVASRGRADLVKICPAVPEADLKALYAAADWFVTLSGYEGFGYPVLEAMACGCPVICHPCTSIPEIAGPAPVPISALNVESTAQAMCNALKMNRMERGQRSDLGRKQATGFLASAASDLFAGLLGKL